VASLPFGVQFKSKIQDVRLYPKHALINLWTVVIILKNSNSIFNIYNNDYSFP